MSIAISLSVPDGSDRFAGRGLGNDRIIVRTAADARVGDASRHSCRENRPARPWDRANRGVAKVLRRKLWSKTANCVLNASAPIAPATSLSDRERVTRSLS